MKKKKKKRRKNDVLVEDGDTNSIEDRKRRHRRKVVADDDNVLFPLDDDNTEDVDILDTSTSEDTALSPTINVTRNETSESMDFIDATTTYKYSKHKEEELVEEVRPLDGGEVISVDQSTTPPVMKASTHTTQEYENIQLIEEDLNNRQTTVTVKVSRQHKKQTVHIANDGLRKKKSSSRKATAATGKGGECLRRIKREWKDAVKTGIAYDWVNRRTINTKERNSNNQYVRIGPYGKNLLRWHFSVLGPANSSYENGVYHGRVLLPKDYPGSPPRVQMLTPSGRFVCAADICLSASNYHPETWSPRWTVISLVNALRLHMLTTANEIGGVNTSEERRREYAQASRSWRYPGVVDHSKMIEIDGIFPLLSVEDADCDDDEVSSNNELVDTNEEEKVDQCDTIIDSVKVANTDPSTAVKRKKKKSAKSKSAKATDGKTSRSKTETTSSEAAVSRDDNNNDYEVLPFLIKRLIIEVLKLPLRIVFILMKLLGIVEYCLKAIINSL